MPTRVFLAKLSFQTTEDDILDFFRSYGRITEIMIKMGYAFVEFSDPRDADDAVHDMDGKYMLGCRVVVDWARTNPFRSGGGGGGGGGGRRGSPRGWRRRSRSPGPARGGGGGGRRGHEYKVVIKNLSTRISWQDLKDEFRRCGEINFANAHHIKDREGFVAFAREKDMRRAVEEMNGKDLNGRKIEVLVDEDSVKSPSRSRSRSRSRSGKRSRSKSRSRSRSRGRKSRRSRSGSRSSRSSSASSRGSKSGKKDRDVKREENGRTTPTKDEKQEKENE